CREDLERHQRGDDRLAAVGEGSVDVDYDMIEMEILAAGNRHQNAHDAASVAGCGSTPRGPTRLTVAAESPARSASRSGLNHRWAIAVGMIADSTTTVISREN